MGRIREFFHMHPIGRAIARKALASSSVANSTAFQWYCTRVVRRRARQLEATLPAINIEGTNACNSRCTMCALQKSSRPTGVMSMDLFRKILAELDGLPLRTVGMSVIGEPLLDPHFFEKMALLKEHGFAVNFFTNGSLLTREKAERLIGLKCDMVHFSIEGLTKKTYESIRVGLDRDVVYGNIERLLRMKSERKLDYPTVLITSIAMDATRGETTDFMKHWRSRPGVDHVLLTGLRNWAGAGTDRPTGQLGQLASRRIWRPPCFQLWRGLEVLWDGTVPMCCDDAPFVRVVIGNVNTQTIEEVWHGEPLRRVRAAHMEKKDRALPVCRECPRTTVWL